MATTNYLESIVKSIGKLPAFPKVAMRVLELANDPDSSIEDIVNAVQFDQAITSNCLKLCNSSYFGLKKKVSTLQHAVTYLGQENIMKIVLADCSGQIGFDVGHEGYGLQPGELWQHSFSTAIISQLITKQIGIKDNPELFTAALLHDIGKLVINNFIADNFESMLNLMLESGFGMVQAEKEFFGIDHAEVGGLIAKIWNFPSSLINAIRNHHQDISKIKDNELDSLTALSNIMFYAADNYLSGAFNKGLICSIDQNLLTRFGLVQSDIISIIKKFPLEIKKAEDFLKIPHS